MLLGDPINAFRLLQRSVELLNKEFVKRIFEGAESDELADHQEDGLAGLSKDLSEEVDYLEICLTGKHDVVEIGEKFGTTGKFLEPLLAADSFKIFLELLLEVSSGECGSLIEE